MEFARAGTTVDHPQLRYWTAGERGPAVLFIMGFGMRGDMWRPQIERLHETHRVAWFDHRGVGESEAGATLFFRTEDLADDALRVLDALGWGEAHVVGVSMGGMVAQEVALRAPGRVKSLALLATLGGGSIVDKLPPLEGLSRFLKANVSEGDRRIEAVQGLLYPSEFLASVDREALRARMEAQLLRPVAPRTLVGQLSAVLRHDAHARLAEASVPTLIVQPERDVLIKPSHSDALQRSLPHARKVTLEDAGHGLIFQSADRVTDAVRAHVDEVERGPGALEHRAPAPAIGGYAEGYRAVAERFAAQLQSGEEVGAGLCVYHRGRLVVDLAGGLADRATGRPWRSDTRLVVFSVTKGLAAIALNVLSDRGQLDWDEKVARYWPEFAQNGKQDVTVRALFEHRAGLAALDAKLSLRDCVEDWPRVVRAMEQQRPDVPASQGYHAITFGMYARALFERIAGESMGRFLLQEWCAPLGSDARLGAGPEWDGRTATLYAPAPLERVGNMLRAGLFDADSREGRVARALLDGDAMGRRAFGTPAVGLRGPLPYNELPVRRAELPWGSATASARGLARAYLPLSLGGAVEGRRYLAAETVQALTARTGWSDRDAVLQKPLGWNRGFLKEEEGIFGPNPEGFGHAGMGGALGWCDPKAGLSIGYVMNRMDWRVRSPRALALCRALYECEAVRG